MVVVVVVLAFVSLCDKGKGPKLKRTNAHLTIIRTQPPTIAIVTIISLGTESEKILVDLGPILRKKNVLQNVRHINTVGVCDELCVGVIASCCV